jgi:hypothetical protein
LRIALPEARVIVVFRNLLETELLVVVRPDPFGRIYRAFFQGRIDLARRNLLGNRAKPLEYLAGKAANTKLQALEVVERVHFPSEPSAHLGAAVSRRHDEDLVIAEKLTHEFQPAPLIHPGTLLPGIQPERQSRIDRKSGIFSNVKRARRVAHLDGLVLNGIQYRGRRHDFTGRKGLDPEPAVRRRSDPASDVLRRTINRIQALRGVRREPPLDLRPALRNSRRGNRRRSDRHARQEIPPFHLLVLPHRLRVI